MMKIILTTTILIISIMLSGCGDPYAADGIGSNTLPVTQSATYYNKLQYSVLKEKNNSSVLNYIYNISEFNNDTVSVSVASPNNYILYTGFPGSSSPYEVILHNYYRQTNFETYFITVKNRNGQVILNQEFPILTVHKIFPCRIQDNLTIPYYDNHTFTFNSAETTQTILFRQVKNELLPKYESVINWLNLVQEYPYSFSSYGFNQANLDNSSTDGNFTVNNTDSYIDYNGVQLSNCLLKKPDDEFCALQITRNNPGDYESVFYMHIDNTNSYDYDNGYIDNAIRLKSTAQ